MIDFMDMIDILCCARWSESREWEPESLYLEYDARREFAERAPDPDQGSPNPNPNQKVVIIDI